MVLVALVSRIAQVPWCREKGVVVILLLEAHCEVIDLPYRPSALREAHGDGAEG
jgi:hypothetical protein